jgi:hypothetical protein
MDLGLEIPFVERESMLRGDLDPIEARRDAARNRSLTGLRRTTGSVLAAAGNIDTLHDGRTLEECFERPHDVRKIGDADQIARLV